MKNLLSSADWTLLCIEEGISVIVDSSFLVGYDVSMLVVSSPEVSYSYSSCGTMIILKD